MSFDKDRAIIAQNSATAAATILAGQPFDAAEYERVRTSIFNGSLALANSAGGATPVERVQAAFPDSEVVDLPQVRHEAPAGRPSGGEDLSAFTLKFGKHRGKTLGAIYDEDPSWLDWAGENTNNEYAKGRIQKFLATV